MRCVVDICAIEGKIMEQMSEQILIQLKSVQNYNTIEICLHCGDKCEMKYYKINANKKWEWVDDKTNNSAMLSIEALSRLIAGDMFYYGQRNVSVFLIE